MIFRMVYKSGLTFPFVTIHAFDVRTDRILIARPRLPSMQRGKKSFDPGQFFLSSIVLCTNVSHRI